MFAEKVSSHFSPSLPLIHQSVDSATSAQRNRLVGVVRVKSTAPIVDAAAVEAKLQQFADLRKIDLTATKVRVVVSRRVNPRQ